jgi:acetolactate synthase-1/2/3 large subunit
VDDFHPLGANVIVGTRMWAETDLLIGVGSRLDNPGRWGATPPGLKVLRIDIDPAEMRRYKPDFGVVADAAAGVAALVVALQALPQPAGRRAEVNAAKLAVADAVAGVQPQVSYLRELAAVLPDDAFIVDEMTQVGYTSWFAYPFRKPGRLIGSGYQGTLGAGFPIALGVKAVNPGTPVVSITGDGGFLFGATELATAVQHKINLVTVLFNNSAYGNVLRDQKRLYQGRHAGAELQNPDFQLFAQSFGVPSWRVENPAAFRSALEAALAENSPTLIEVITDIAQETSPWPLVFPTRP